MKYVEVVDIERSEYDRINRLLSIESILDLSDEQCREIGANTLSTEGVLFVEFEDGSTLNFDLRSDNGRYYDDVVWTSPDGSEDIILDYEYAIDDIEFEWNGDEYFVKLNIMG